MLPLQYGETEEFTNYHYKSNLLNNSTGNLKARIKRLAQEHSDLSHSLPLSTVSSSIWLRASVERMDAVQFMISGPVDTPYSNGLFLFDAYFPESYPNMAPKINLNTTGKGSVRFNPNLYNCGKVCLSLLGTWPGRPEESWNASSTFLQVMVSIQGLILVEDPYFNEPGFQQSMGTPSGQAESTRYNDKIREQTVRWGMVEMLKNPPKGFEIVVKTHFKLRKESILRQIARWAEEASSSRRAAFKSLQKTMAIQIEQAFQN